MPAEATTQLAAAVIWSLLLIGAVALVGVVAWRVRRWSKASSRQEDDESTWSLHKLRELRASGQLSDAEFEKLRAGVLGSVGNSGERSNERNTGAIDELSPKASAGAHGAAKAQSSPRATNDIKTPSKGGR